MMIKRGKGDKQGESMVASYEYLEVSNLGLQMTGSNKCDVPVLQSTILRSKKPLSSWNHVNPIFSMNEVWIDECDARLQTPGR